jgi:SM-20-related protein
VLQTINLELHLEEILNSGWTLLDLDLTAIRQLAKLAAERFANASFRMATVSEAKNPLLEIRNDHILWLDAKNLQFADAELQILNDLESLKTSLKNYFRIHLSELECHYAIYDPGHFYQRHSDITKYNNQRVFSFVIYLNEDWEEKDSGALVGYKPGQNVTEQLFTVLPHAGKMILFKSDIEHEVLKTNRQRLSLTGWFRK